MCFTPTDAFCLCHECSPLSSASPSPERPVLSRHSAVLATRNCPRIVRRQEAGHAVAQRLDASQLGNISKRRSTAKQGSSELCDGASVSGKSLSIRRVLDVDLNSGEKRDACSPPVLFFFFLSSSENFVFLSFPSLPSLSFFFDVYSSTYVYSIPSSRSILEKYRIDLIFDSVRCTRVGFHRRMGRTCESMALDHGLHLSADHSSLPSTRFR